MCNKQTALCEIDNKHIWLSRKKWKLVFENWVNSVYHRYSQRASQREEGSLSDTLLRSERDYGKTEGSYRGEDERIRFFRRDQIPIRRCYGRIQELQWSERLTTTSSHIQ